MGWLYAIGRLLKSFGKWCITNPVGAMLLAGGLTILSLIFKLKFTQRKLDKAVDNEKTAVIEGKEAVAAVKDQALQEEEKAAGVKGVEARKKIEEALTGEAAEAWKRQQRRFPKKWPTRR